MVSEDSGPPMRPLTGTHQGRARRLWLTAWASSLPPTAPWPAPVPQLLLRPSEMPLSGEGAAWSASNWNFEVKRQKEAPTSPLYQSSPLRHYPKPSPHVPTAQSWEHQQGGGLPAMGYRREIACLRPRLEGILTPEKSQTWSTERERTL